MRTSLFLFYLFLSSPLLLEAKGLFLNIQNTALTPLKRGSEAVNFKSGSMGMNPGRGSAVVPSRIGSVGAGSLCFVENKGQVKNQYGGPRKDIQYKLDGGNVTVFVGAGGLHYQWWGTSPGPSKGGGHSGSGEVQPLKGYRMDVELVGANKAARVIADEEQGYYERYYGDNHKQPEGILAHTFKKVTYKDIYPHIDWVLYVRDGRMEYDFEVHPGGRVSDIQMAYKGADSIVRSGDGGIRSCTPMGSIGEARPVSYEQETGRLIASSFRLKGKRLSFTIEGKPNGTLVIDPALIWATYYGNNSWVALGWIDLGSLSNVTDAPCNVVCDAGGNAYLAGYTNSNNNIATTGAYQSSLSSSPGIFGSSFLCAFNASGNRLWGTYFNGAIVYAMASDPSGYLYIAGDTRDTSISTPGAYQDTLGGLTDDFIAKFSTSGTLQWCTYYGGEGGEDGDALSCDANGNVYLTGVTTSQTGIATPGAYQSVASAVYLAKFSSSGNLLWSTYYGGSGAGEGYGVACDAAGNVYMGGYTLSTSGIASPGAFQTTYNGLSDGFLTKFDGSGNFQWGTYYGGAGGEDIYAVSCDLSGNVYVGGFTYSTSGIASSGAYQTSLGDGPPDAFLAKFDGSGNRLWGTYYGGGGNDVISGIACNSKGEVCVSGATTSNNGIATNNATQANLEGGISGFWAKFSPSGGRLFGTYFGGPSQDCSSGIACHDSTSVYISGYATSSSGIASDGAYQTVLSSLQSPFLAHFDNDSLYLGNPFPDTVLCQGDSLRVAYYTDVSFANGNVFTAELSDASGSFGSPTVIGMLGAVGSDSIACRLPVNIAAGTHYRIRVMASQPFDSSLADGKDITINTVPQVSVASNSPVCSGDSLGFTVTAGAGNSYVWTGPNSYSSNVKNAKRTNIALVDSGSYIVTATGSNGCNTKDTTGVTVKPTPAGVTAGNNGPVCEGGALSLNGASSTAGVSYGWAGPGGYSSSSQNPVLGNVSPGQGGNYTVTVSLNGCHATATTAAVVNATTAAPQVTISASPGDSVCADEAVTFTAVVTDGGSSPQYQWRRNGTDISGATTASYTETGVIGNNDAVSCYVTGNAICQPQNTATSNYIILHTVTYPMPGITITEYPAVFEPGDTATFTAIVTNGNPASLSFQWLLNGLPVAGATGSTYQSTQLNMGDEVSLYVHSNRPCTVPDSLVTNSIDLAVGATGSGRWGIRIYPNPAKGQVTIETGKAGLQGSVTVYDLAGRAVYNGAIKGQQTDISLPVPAGVYMVEVEDGQGGRWLQRLVME